MNKLTIMTVFAILIVIAGFWSPTSGAGNAAATSNGVTLTDSKIDTDNDGLTDEIETALRTDPNNRDTDGDGIIDGGDPDILAGVILSLPDAAFKKGEKGLRNTILVHLDNIKGRFLAGAIEQGIKELENLRRRVDGCSQQADQDDWIIDCKVQLWVRQIIDLLMANHFSYQVNNSPLYPERSIPGLSGGPARPVGVAIGPDGKPEEFVINEVILQPVKPDELNTFLTRYGGTVIRDGTPFILEEGVVPPSLPQTTGWYLVRVDPRLSRTDDLAENMEAAGLRGSWSFSSDQAARLMALIARERSRNIGANYIARQDCAVCEHPILGGYLDAARWWWMTEDDNPAAPGDQGLSIGVVHAWEYLKYQGYPPMTPYLPVRVAVIDSGFDLDETTGYPMNGNEDYINLLSGTKPPLQIDAVDSDWTAGGTMGGWQYCPNCDKCATQLCPSCCWHGQVTFGVCCATARNFFGTAGTSGGEVIPILIRISQDIYTIAHGVFDAYYNHADVISMSISFECGWTCRYFQGGNALKAAVYAARDDDRIVVSSSGNDREDISNADRYPCKLNGDICVGAINNLGRAPDSSNYGSVVDIWAPSGILTTVTRNSAAFDADNLGEDELNVFHGNSCSAPYVAGIVAAMKMLNHTLSYDEVRNILVHTANSSDDPKVTPGYVDAYRALVAAKPNQPPSVAFIQPANGVSVPYRDARFEVSVVDPELAGPYGAQFKNTVTFFSNRDGVLCNSIGPSGPNQSCTTTKPMSLGAHSITAVATDAFGAQASTSITVSVINTPPVAKITYPVNAAVFFTTRTTDQEIKINLQGYGHDPDQAILSGSLSWSSSVAGNLGTGSDIWVNLPLGDDQIITLTAVDEQGALGTDSIKISVKKNPEGYPSAMITEPSNNMSVQLGDLITFVGQASDPEDGNLTGPNLKWYSNIDGFLGEGESIQKTLSGVKCQLGGTSTTHTITLEVTDSNGNKATYSISVTVMDLC